MTTTRAEQRAIWLTPPPSIGLRHDGGEVDSAVAGICLSSRARAQRASRGGGGHARRPAHEMHTATHCWPIRVRLGHC